MLLLAGPRSLAPPAARACAKDIKQHCSHVSPDEEGGVLSCLRTKRPELRGRCKVTAPRVGRPAGPADL